MRLRPVPLLVLALSVAAVGGCGDGADEVAADEPATTTSARGGGNQAATTAPPPDGTLPEVEGDAFDDPDGTYEIVIDPEWERDDARAGSEGLEFWLVAKDFDGFIPNVNLLTQTTGGIDLQEYLDLSVEGAGDYIDDVEMLDERTVEGTEGDELGLLEYTGSIDGLDLHFLQLIAVDDDEAVVATFTAPDGRFEDLRPEIEPYLFTLRSD